MNEIQQTNGIYRTVCCSYPRSGQSLIGPILEGYFGSRFKYCEWYRDPDKRPNVCPETNFVKTHDRDLNWHIREDWKYLVLIRDPLKAVSSWRMMDFEQDYNIGWKLEYWAKWATRWVVNPVPNRLIVSYESLIERPKPILREILRHLSDNEINDDLLHGLIVKQDVSPRRNHTQEWLGYL